MTKLWQWIKEHVAFSADVAAIAVWLGLPFATVWGVAVGVAARLADIPWFWAMIGAPVASVCALGAWWLVIALRRPSETLDLAAWKGHAIYTVWVAACLWAERRPWPSIPADSPAYPALQLIKGAVQAGHISIVSGAGNMQSRVTREELIKLALQHGARPRFLFE